MLKGCKRSKRLLWENLAVQGKRRKGAMAIFQFKEGTLWLTKCMFCYQCNFSLHVVLEECRLQLPTRLSMVCMLELIDTLWWWWKLHLFLKTSHNQGSDQCWVGNSFIRIGIPGSIWHCKGIPYLTGNFLVIFLITLPSW